MMVLRQRRVSRFSFCLIIGLVSIFAGQKIAAMASSGDPIALASQAVDLIAESIGRLGELDYSASTITLRLPNPTGFVPGAGVGRVRVLEFKLFPGAGDQFSPLEDAAGIERVESGADLLKPRNFFSAAAAAFAKDQAKKHGESLLKEGYLGALLRVLSDALNAKSMSKQCVFVCKFLLLVKKCWERGVGSDSISFFLREAGKLMTRLALTRDLEIFKADRKLFDLVPSLVKDFLDNTDASISPRLEELFTRLTALVRAKNMPEYQECFYDVFLFIDPALADGFVGERVIDGEKVLVAQKKQVQRDMTEFKKQVVTQPSLPLPGLGFRGEIVGLVESLRSPQGVIQACRSLFRPCEAAAEGQDVFAKIMEQVRALKNGETVTVDAFFRGPEAVSTAGSSSDAAGSKQGAAAKAVAQTQGKVVIVARTGLRRLDLPDTLEFLSVVLLGNFRQFMDTLGEAERAEIKRQQEINLEHQINCERFLATELGKGHKIRLEADIRAAYVAPVQEPVDGQPAVQAGQEEAARIPAAEVLRLTESLEKLSKLPLDVTAAHHKSIEAEMSDIRARLAVAQPPVQGNGRGRQAQSARDDVFRQSAKRKETIRMAVIAAYERELATLKGHFEEKCRSIHVDPAEFPLDPDALFALRSANNAMPFSCRDYLEALPEMEPLKAYIVQFEGDLRLMREQTGALGICIDYVGQHGHVGQLGGLIAQARERSDFIINSDSPEVFASIGVRHHPLFQLYLDKVVADEPQAGFEALRRSLLEGVANVWRNSKCVDENRCFAEFLFQSLVPQGDKIFRLALGAMP